jgi:SAM-dependent methyltransferase
MNNYDYCTDFALASAPRNATISVLDYGCGAGEIVSALRKKQIDAFGCDVFYAGGDYSTSVQDWMRDTIIRKIEDGTIPFPTNSFDIVINNQVMEHVENLDLALSEINRVLKPGGKVLSMFPHKGVWREGHCGIPFLHRFSRQSHARIYYAFLFRVLGFGHNKGAKGCLQWSKDICDWLDKWTWYRHLDDIKQAYEKEFVDIKFIEDHWLDKRFGGISSLFPKAIKHMVVRKLGGLVFVCTKM